MPPYQAYTFVYVHANNAVDKEAGFCVNSGRDGTKCSDGPEGVADGDEHDEHNGPRGQKYA
jgi:hypothetical protein